MQAPGSIHRISSPENISEDVWGEEIVLVFRGEKHYRQVWDLGHSEPGVSNRFSHAWGGQKRTQLGGREGVVIGFRQG